MKHPLTEYQHKSALTDIDEQGNPIGQQAGQRVRLLSYNIQVGIASTSLRSSIATAWML